MTLLKQINAPTLLLPYEQMYIMSIHHNNELTPEYLNKHNLCLTSFIQILHVISHLTFNPQSHAFQPVLSQSVHGTATYRVSTS